MRAAMRDGAAVAMRLLALATVLFLLQGQGPPLPMVTLCAADDQPGPGINLTTALASPSAGPITFNCHGIATIAIHQDHTILRNTVIDGGHQITLDASSTSGVFSVEPVAGLTLIGITIANGNGRQGSAISNRGGSLTIQDSAFLKSTEPVFSIGPTVITGTRFQDGVGPAVEASTLTLSNSRFVNITGLSILFSSGVANIDRTQFMNGGAARFANCIKVTIRNSSFSGNVSTGSPFWGGALSLSCPAEIDDTQFNNNKGLAGGAIEFTPAAITASMEGVTFTGNVATKSGGAIALDSNNGDPRSIDIRYGIFKNNVAPIGGAMDLGQDSMNATKFTGYAVQFVGNQAASGGGLSGVNASVVLNRAIFTSNTATQQGAAMFLRQTKAAAGTTQPQDQIANALIVKNTAPSGSAVSDSNVLLLNSTIADNQGEALSFAAASGDASWQRVALKNTIVSNNAGGNCQPQSAGLGAVGDAGNNLQFPEQSCGASIKLASPDLDTFYDPIIGSPAIGAGDITTCLGDNVRAIDVFGQPRPQHGPDCSIGALEGDIDRPVDTAKQER